MADTSTRRDRLRDWAAPALLGANRGLQIGDRYLAAWCLDLFAVAVAAAGDQQRAAAILAAVDTSWHAMHVERPAEFAALVASFLASHPLAPLAESGVSR